MKQEKQNTETNGQQIKKDTINSKIYIRFTCYMTIGQCKNTVSDSKQGVSISDIHSVKLLPK